MAETRGPLAGAPFLAREVESPSATRYPPPTSTTGMSPP